MWLDWGTRWQQRCNSRCKLNQWSCLGSNNISGRICWLGHFPKKGGGRSVSKNSQRTPLTLSSKPIWPNWNKVEGKVVSRLEMTGFCQVRPTTLFSRWNHLAWQSLWVQQPLPQRWPWLQWLEDQRRSCGSSRCRSWRTWYWAAAWPSGKSSPRWKSVEVERMGNSNGKNKRKEFLPLTNFTNSEQIN